MNRVVCCYWQRLGHWFLNSEAFAARLANPDYERAFLDDKCALSEYVNTMFTQWLSRVKKEDYYFFIITESQLELFNTICKDLNLAKHIFKRSEQGSFNRRYPNNGKCLHWVMFKFDTPYEMPTNHPAIKFFKEYLNV